MAAWKLWTTVHPEKVIFSPMSGFHHGRPKSSDGFCRLNCREIPATSHQGHEQRGH